MYLLRNNLNSNEAKAKIAAEKSPRKTISFYRYVHLADPMAVRDQLFAAWSALGVLGRVYVANEGINAQISVPEQNVKAFRAELDATTVFAEAPIKFAIEESILPFWKLIIKVRKQIVADNLPEKSYDITNVGNHLDAKTFNEEIENGAIVVDMRNKYESDIGKFETAITPSSQTFSNELQEVLTLLADKKEEKILLYCTGGIRCEKASAFLKHNGFADVNQLYGGIIQYKHQITQEGTESKFHGKNFVFDARMAETVTDEILGKCYTCKAPADQYRNCQSDLCHALFIQCHTCHEQTLGTCSTECQAIASLPNTERVAIRKNRKPIFKVLTS